MMKKLVMLALIALLPMALFAQSSGDKKDIDGQKFTYNGKSWVHDALGEKYTAEKAYATVYRDKTWQKWYAEGDATLKKIMDLGPNVVFKYKGTDGQYHTYSVYSSKAAMKAAVGTTVASATGATVGGGAAAGGAAAAATGGGISTTALIIGGAAVVAGGVIIAENDSDDDDGTPTKR